MVGCEYVTVTQGAEYAWINLNMPYKLDISPWICLNSAEYASICLHIPEQTEFWICHDPEYVW